MKNFRHKNFRHGHSVKKTPTYESWRKMRQRVIFGNDKRSYRYVGRGISICSRWDKFENFLEDMGERPEGMTIDRIDNDGDYEPENCRWATNEQQQRNSSQVKMITVDGKSLCAGEWEELTGIKRDTHSPKDKKVGMVRKEGH